MYVCMYVCMYIYIYMEKYIQAIFIDFAYFVSTMMYQFEHISIAGYREAYNYKSVWPNYAENMAWPINL